VGLITKRDVLPKYGTFLHISQPNFDEFVCITGRLSRPELCGFNYQKGRSPKIWHIPAYITTKFTQPAVKPDRSLVLTVCRSVLLSAIIQNISPCARFGDSRKVTTFHCVMV